MPRRYHSPRTMLARERLATASIFVCDGWTPSFPTTMPTNYCHGAHHMDLGKFIDSRNW